MTKLRPFLRFYGGKFRQAARLLAPRYDLIVEPFAGSLGYSVRYGGGRKVIGLDRDPTIVGIWQWLLDARPEDVRALPTLAPFDDLRSMTSLDRRARDLIGLWLNPGCTMPCNRPSKWMREFIDGRSETYWGAPVRDRIADQLDAIADWRVDEADYSDAPDVEATWLIDPPYCTTGKRYRYGSDAIDYRSLGEWCRSRRGQVIVCEHVGADWLPFEPVSYRVKSAVNRAGARGGYSVEAIWIA